MKITFLGTAAAEMYPNAFCACPNCARSLKAGGRNVRGNSAALVDDDILFDLNGSCRYTAALHGLSLNAVTRLFVTHAHEDHFLPVGLKCRCAPLAGVPPFDPDSVQWSARFTALPFLTVYGNAFVRDAFERMFPPETLAAARYDMAFCLIEEGVERDLGDCAFVAVRANHSREKGFCHNYILRRGGKTLLYATDTGGYDADQLDVLTRSRYDCVVMESTFGLSARDAFTGDLPTGNGHMSLRKDIVMRDYLLKRGCIAADTPFALTHLCPHYAPPHDEYEEIVREHGFLLAYDGMIIEF